MESKEIDSNHPEYNRIEGLEGVEVDSSAPFSTTFKDVTKSTLMFLSFEIASSSGYGKLPRKVREYSSWFPKQVDL